MRISFALLGLAATLHAQPTALTLQQAVDAALHNYSAIKVSQEEMNAAAAGIRLARTSYLPRIDTTAQVNRATRNNVFGLLLPQSVIPSMSGPVLGTNNTGTVWGSAIGALVSWEPFDFGERRAAVDSATATRAQSEAALKRTEYEIAVATADAYLTLVAAQETVRTAQASVERADSLVRTTRALVVAELRPGADSARTDAELAAARTQLIQAEQAVNICRATLAKFLAVDPATIRLAAPRLEELPPAPATAPLDTGANPIVLEQNAAIEETRARLHQLERSYFPHFYLQGAVYARGTGAETNGNNLGGMNGLAPTVQNFALGFSVTFPVMDKPAIEAREAAQSATLRAQQARAAQIATDLRAQWNTAVATLDGARRVAANTPVQVSAARAAMQQATARYQSGLGAIDAVAEAQRLQTEAEIGEALSRLSVWRALLQVATAAGDIRPFVAEVGQ